MRSYLLLLLVWTSVSGQTDDIRFEKISTQHGLSQDIVKTITQDKEGFMWFGTEDGLNRYDGYTMTVYKHDPLDSSSISSNDIECLYVDREGVLWVGTAKGLNRYDDDQDRFAHVLIGDPRNWKANWINCLTEDSLGNLWVGTGEGVVRYDARSKFFTRYAHDSSIAHSLSDNVVTCILLARTGVLWVGTMHGLNRFVDKGDQFIQYHPKAHKQNSLSSDSITALHQDSEGRLWIGTFWGGLNLFEGEKNGFIHYRHDPRNSSSLIFDLIFAISSDNEGTVWIGTFFGLDRFYPQQNTFIHSRADPSPNSERVYAVYEDRAHVMWIGTYRDGISRYDPSNQRFRRIQSDPHNSSSLSSNEVRAILEDRFGVLWIGTGGGLNRYDKESHRFFHYLHNVQTANSISDDQIEAIFEDRAGELWIGTQFGGLNRFDRRTDSFVHYRPDPKNQNSLGHERVRIVYEDSFGDFWIGGGDRGLEKFDRKNNTFMHYRENAQDPNTLRGLEVSSIYEDSHRNLWIGATGLNLYDRKTNSFSHYQNDPSNSQTLSHNIVRSMYEDSRGLLWLATWGGGLDCYDPKTGLFKHYTEKNGLASNYTKGILADNHGNLWISTENGISKFNLGSGTFRNYTAQDGLQGDYFLGGAYYKDRSGQFYFGGENGLSAFYPDSIKDNTNLPPVVITTFKILDKSASLSQSISRTKEVQLSYSQDAFSFEFVALDYTNPKKNQYAYIMEGFDKHWVYSGTRRYAAYTHLDGGEYVFRVKGSNNDGVWNEAGASVKLIIAPPYWRTWWFRISAVVFVFGATGWTIRSIEMRRIKVKIRKLEQEAALERERARIARDMHDDFGARLTQIRLLSELSQRNLTDHPKTESNLHEISETARDIVDSFQEIVWSVNPKYDTLDNFADFLTQYASGYLGKAGLRCRLGIPAFLQSLKMSADIRHNMMMVVKEVLNNTVKHAAASEVDLKLSCDDHALSIVIRDNGKGFSLENIRRFGNGLANMRRRLESIGGEIQIESKSGDGTKVTVSVGIRESKK